MPRRLTSRARSLAGGLGFRWAEILWDRLRGRPPCPLLVSLRGDPSLRHHRVERELHEILRTILGRRLTPHVVGSHPHRQSLTDLVASGARQAPRLLPYVQADESILEYGGGIGRLGRAIAPHVRRLMSVDVEPLMKEYGRRLSPGVEFRDLDELPARPEFDGAYSVAVFFHLTLEQQQRALAYVWERLRPGGWFLVDVKLGPCTTGPWGRPGNVGETALEDFRALYDPLFTAEPVRLFNSGFLLRKRDPPAAGG